MTTETSTRRLATVALLVLGALVLLPALFMGFGMMGFGMMGGGMWGSWGGPGTAPTWMPIVALVGQVALLALLAAFGYLLYRAVTTDGKDRALEELRGAYARGDLTDEEYERRRETLERDR